MKRSVFYVLILGMIFGGANTVSAQHEHPQHNHHGMAHQTAAGVKLEVKDDAAQEMTLRLGPVDLPAHTDHMATAQPPDLFWAVPIDGWLVGYHPRLVDVAGNLEPGRLLHHVAFWNTSRSDFLCPNKEEHLFGAGGEMNDWPAVPGYGYRVRQGERIRIETMFHNPTDTSHPQTYLEIRIEYRAGSAAAGQMTEPIKSVYPTWFDVMQCGHSGYDLKAGKNVTTGEITVKYAGTLLGVGGHLHDYGRRLVLENLTRNEEVAALDAKLDAAGRIVAMPVQTFLDRGGYRLNRGERLRVTATYDNPEGKPLPGGAMGIVVGYFVPDNDTQMAALQRKSK